MPLLLLLKKTHIFDCRAAVEKKWLWTIVFAISDKQNCLEQSHLAIAILINAFYFLKYKILKIVKR